MIHSLRVLGSVGVVHACYADSTGWINPHGGLFTSADVKSLDDFARGESDFLLLNDIEVDRPRLVVKFEVSS